MPLLSIFINITLIGNSSPESVQAVLRMEKVISVTNILLHIRKLNRLHKIIRMREFSGGLHNANYTKNLLHAHCLTN